MMGTPRNQILLVLLLISLSVSESIDQFSWDNFNGTSFVPEVQNQNIPNACNSGWAFSAVDVLNSRMKIARKAASPDFEIAVQVLLSCDQLDFGCMGGEPNTAFKWIRKNNITDSSCQTYLGKGYTNGYGCSSQVKCQHCDSGICRGAPNSKIFSIHDYGNVATENDMKGQIQNYGPIACGMNNTVLNNYTNDIIMSGSPADNRINHYVLVYGWGQETKANITTKYWKVKNSWGAAWGDKGHFRIQRGSNAYGIESKCHWGNPQDTWTSDIRNKTVPNNPLVSQLAISESGGVSSYDIPQFLTPIRSAVTPSDCISSWAFAVVQMIADRASKQSRGKNATRLSVQALINCGVGKCSKETNPMDALIFIEKYGLPDESCQNYIGEDPPKVSCNGVSNCGYCSGSAFDFKCYEYKSYKRWRIKDYAFIGDIPSMKNELVSGPIVCGIYASESFKRYNGGIFSELSIAPKINHYVEVVGYGTQNGVDYWLARNFWGTAWGESSFFRIQMKEGNLGITTKCYVSRGLI